MRLQPLEHIGAVARWALVGPGRAGSALTAAWLAAGGSVAAVAGRDPNTPSVVDAARRFGASAVDVAAAGGSADIVLIAVPDAFVGEVAARVAPSARPGALVLHCSGVHSLAVFGPARTAAESRVRWGSLHPLMTIPRGVDGPGLAGAGCAVEGPEEVRAIARALGMSPFTVAPERRAAYHAAAVIASNHLVALLAQVERVSGLPIDAFLPLVRRTVDNVASLGPVGALTGPVARGDAGTVRAHLEALPAAEREAYLALARQAARVCGRPEAVAAVPEGACA